MAAFWDQSNNLVIRKPFEVAYPDDHTGKWAQKAEMTADERDAVVNDFFKHPLIDLGPVLDQVRNTDLPLPSSDITTVQELVVDCKNEVKVLDAKIGDLISSIVALSRELSDTSCRFIQKSRQLRLGEYLLSLRPAKHLPQDILEQIFLACWEGQSLTDPLATTSAPLQLAAVSHRWRAIALSMPTLWSNIRIYRPPSIPRAIAWFHRCRTPILTLDLSLDSTSHRLDEFLESVQQSSIRFRKMELYISDRDIAQRAWSVLFNSPSDDLQELVLLDRHRPDSIPNSVRRLYLHNPPASWVHSPPPPHLTILCIGMLDVSSSLHWKMVESILFHCPNLERVTLRAIEAGLEPQCTDRLGSLISPTTLQHLVYFGFTNGCAADGLPRDFLGNFNFPNLRVFEYKVEREAGTRPAWLIAHPLLAHIRRFTLQIEPEVSLDDFSSILSMASSLEEFSICSTDDSLLHLFQLLSSSSSATPNLLPSLKSFHMGGWYSRTSSFVNPKPELIEFIRAWSPEVRGDVHLLTHLTFQSWYDGRNQAHGIEIAPSLQEANPSLKIRVIRYTSTFLMADIPLLFTTYPLPFNGGKAYDVLEAGSSEWKAGVGHNYTIM
ncbi:hypothetical protein BDN72DRAFT_962353 [Pluteus cervinus]|uniref:Uncharacterized protein n=1 Tax=Pluteus cervinus TaxID=181527 RepID=A0ACD3AJ37_9AGAR|nr:hypothetical protein BDN72DRAFT_962353 [Pluteus cervinus]